MAGYYVIVDDDCGTSHSYLVPGAENPNVAAKAAERMFDAHHSVGGRAQIVFPQGMAISRYCGQPWECSQAILIGVGPEDRGLMAKYYDRTLSDFADDIITRATPTRDGQGWYAVLDWPPGSRETLDFAYYGRTAEIAQRQCAASIRERYDGKDPKGFGRPGCMDAYGLHFILAPHWQEKETLRAFEIMVEESGI